MHMVDISAGGANGRNNITGRVSTGGNGYLETSMLIFFSRMKAGLYISPVCHSILF